MISVSYPGLGFLFLTMEFLFSCFLSDSVYPSRFCLSFLFFPCTLVSNSLLADIRHTYQTQSYHPIIFSSIGSICRFCVNFSFLILSTFFPFLFFSGISFPQDLFRSCFLFVSIYIIVGSSIFFNFSFYLFWYLSFS